MLTSEERKSLQALLAHAVRPEEGLTLDQLEGYLFGIVITPEEVRPNEWFADIFGDALATFADGGEADARFAALQQAYDRLKILHQLEELRFPFALEEASPEQLARVRDWAVGLDRALARRSWLWLPEERLEQPEMDAADEEIMTCLMVVLGVAYPEKIPEIFEDVDAQGEEEQEIWRSLVCELPMAVGILQARAAQLEVGGTRAVKPDHHAACSCGSGKSYEKCCGLN